MLGVTSYAEALRVLGRFVEQQERVGAPVRPARQRWMPPSLLIEEDTRAAHVIIRLSAEAWTLDVPAVEALVVKGPARRGKKGKRDGLLTDVLRTVGQALDDVQAGDVQIRVSAQGVDAVLGQSGAGTEQRLSFTAEDVVALEKAAAARRRGGPPQRVLILHDHAPLRCTLQELLVTEFAVQDLGLAYGPAIAEAHAPAELLLLHVTDPERLATLLTYLRLLKGAPSTRPTPVIVLAAAGVVTDPPTIFQAGADDLVIEPCAPALLRARLRTWFLRGSATARAAPDSSVRLSLDEEHATVC